MRYPGKRKERIYNVLFTAIFFVFAMYLFNLIRYFGLEDTGGTGDAPGGLWQITFNSFLGGAIVGIILDILDNILDRKNIRQKSFVVVVLLKTVAAVITFFIAFVIVYMVTSVFMFDKPIVLSFESLKIFLTGKFFWVNMIYGLVLIFIINFLKQTDRKVGPGILFKFFMGRYHKPIEEDRIFMFLDLKSSTTIAEKLGHIRYSNFIQDCFSDLTEAVRNHNAEIYQYVGDEAVLTWKIKDGIKNANCVYLYFEYDKALNEKKSYYLEKYETIPIFKAGINCGMATTAEVGEIKSEIAYHGDVLNTAARIQAQCNVYQKNLLISEDLKEMLERFSFLKFENMGDIVLRGKKKSLNIYSVEVVNGNE